ncbi:MAG: hypothetical protein VKI81_11640, partial [Synechococcaceae cyanobacterium]|nr:hypothetical protein [Synechococcaceae cyanobacterium]
LTANGPGVATTVDVSGNGMVFAAGQSYGILVTSSNGQTLEYTTGAPTTFTGTHCELTSNAGSFYSFSFAWPDRIFNGALHTELAAPSGPALAVSGSCPGPVSLDATGMTAGGSVAFAYSVTAGGWAIPGGPVCVGTLLPLVQPTLLGTRAADAGGAASFTGNAPAAACATISVAALDLATCAPTAAVTL